MQIDRAATSMLAASTSYAGFQNGLYKAIVSIRKPIQTFSTGGQFGMILFRNPLYAKQPRFLSWLAATP